MKKEVYSDVIKESDEKLEKAKNGEETSKLLKEESKRIKNSIGNIDFEMVKWARKDSNIVEEKESWDVTLEDGSGYETSSQSEAVTISYLAQINFRLMRLENTKCKCCETEDILKDKSLMKQIEESEKNIKKGKIKEFKPKRKV